MSEVIFDKIKFKIIIIIILWLLTFSSLYPGGQGKGLKLTTVFR